MICLLMYQISRIIAEVTQILGEADLSLTNIKILETKEIYGILQLSFKNQSTTKAAKQILSKKTDYTCYAKYRGDEGCNYI